MMNPQEVERRIRAALPDATVTLTDLTGTQDHYQVRVVSVAFDGMSPLQRHRAVYRALNDAVGGAVHALAIEAKTPAEAATAMPKS